MLYYSSVIKRVFRRYAAVAQSVERRIGSAEVTGPIPVSSLENPWLMLGVFDFDICFGVHFMLHPVYALLTEPNRRSFSATTAFIASIS